MNLRVDCWVRFQHLVQSYEATTEALSRTGLLVKMIRQDGSGQLAKAGEAMEVDVALPPTTSGQRRVMHCTGNVVHSRVDEKGTWWITADIRTMKFRDRPQGLGLNGGGSGEVVM